MRPSPLQRLYGMPDPLAWGPPDLDVGVDPPAERPEAVAAARAPLERWRDSTAAAEAIVAATELEDMYYNIDTRADLPHLPQVQRKDLMAKVAQYQHALERLKVAEPDLPDDAFAVDPRLANESNSTPCPYGFGRTVKWPWGLQIERLGFCCENCYCSVLEHARVTVVNTALGLDWE